MTLGRAGRENRDVVCEACGLPGHRAVSCNRPEGIALRGGKLRMHEQPIGFSSVPYRSVERGGLARSKTRGRRAGRRP